MNQSSRSVAQVVTPEPVVVDAPTTRVIPSLVASLLDESFASALTCITDPADRPGV